MKSPPSSRRWASFLCSSPCLNRRCAMNKPSPAEIAFAQKRFQIQPALAPYFLQRVDSAGFQACEVDGDLATADGTRLREDTIKGQSSLPVTADHGGRRFSRSRLDDPAHEEWWPAVTVFTNHGGPTPTTVIKNDVDAGDPLDLKKRIDEVFRSIPPKQ